MARSVNRVTLVGNAGSDPDVRTTEAGTTVAHVSLATDRVYRQNGERRSRTDWHRLTFWGRAAETVEKYLRKGARIYVEGRIEYGSYERDGVTIPTSDVVVRDFVFLDSSNGAPGGWSAEEEASREEATEDPDAEAEKEETEATA